MKEPELILATLTHGAAALFVNSDAILTTDASARACHPETVAKYLAKALGVELLAVHQPEPDDPAWSWNDVHAAITPRAAASGPMASGEICVRLLNSEEHAVEAAVPPVAEDAVHAIHALQAELVAERLARHGLEVARVIADDLLEHALRFADVKEESATRDAWSSIRAAQAYLRKTSVTESGRRQVPGVLSDSAQHRAKVLESLRADGLTIGECVRTLTVPNDDPYVCAARAQILGDDDVEIDDSTTTSVGEDGAWVLAWLWISDDQAGIRADGGEPVDA